MKSYKNLKIYLKKGFTTENMAIKSQLAQLILYFLNYQAIHIREKSLQNYSR